MIDEMKIQVCIGKKTYLLYYLIGMLDRSHGYKDFDLQVTWPGLACIYEILLSSALFTVSHSLSACYFRL